MFRPTQPDYSGATDPVRNHELQFTAEILVSIKVIEKRRQWIMTLQPLGMVHTRRQAIAERVKQRVLPIDLGVRTPHCHERKAPFLGHHGSDTRAGREGET